MRLLLTKFASTPLSFWSALNPFNKIATHWKLSKEDGATLSAPASAIAERNRVTTDEHMRTRPHAKGVTGWKDRDFMRLGSQQAWAVTAKGLNPAAAHNAPSARPRPPRCTPPDAIARDHERWQVSWLTGRRLGPPSQGDSPVAFWSYGSPLTVAGAAPALRNFARTGFPFDPRREPSGLIRSRPIDRSQQNFAKAPHFKKAAGSALCGAAALARIRAVGPTAPQPREDCA